MDIDAVAGVDPPLEAYYLLPGLVDTQVHVGRFPEARATAEKILDEAGKAADLLVLTANPLENTQIHLVIKNGRLINSQG